LCSGFCVEGKDLGGRAYPPEVYLKVG